MSELVPSAGTVDLVAFVDDDETLRIANLQTLALAGLRGMSFASAEAALAIVDESFPGIVVTDVRMPGMDGLQLFRRLKALDADLPVILVTGHGDVEMAVSALKEGAWDFLTKPFGSDALIASVRRALEARRLAVENRRLRAAAEAAQSEVLIGQSTAMHRLRESIRQLAVADVDVLIEGEAGVGKELAAALLHRSSRRRSHPFVPVNCSALPSTLAEGELFGFQNGAIPGSRLSREGLIASADRGTLFVDELDGLPSPLQARLLRVLEECEFLPVGGTQPVAVDVRIAAAIRTDPVRLIASGQLREDLYYRLNVVRLRIPPLRERRQDIPLLFAHFLQDAADRRRIAPRSITEAILRRLHDHDWPGNVRELKHFASSFAVGLESTMTYDEQSALSSRSLPERTQEFEAAAIRYALQQSEGDIRRTLERLRIPRKTFYDKIARLGILPADFRPRR